VYAECAFADADISVCIVSVVRLAIVRASDLAGHYARGSRLACFGFGLTMVQAQG
jgi:hypothetical protein